MWTSRHLVIHKSSRLENDLSALTQWRGNKLNRPSTSSSIKINERLGVRRHWSAPWLQCTAQNSTNYLGATWTRQCTGKGMCTRFTGMVYVLVTWWKVFGLLIYYTYCTCDVCTVIDLDFSFSMACFLKFAAIDFFFFSDQQFACLDSSNAGKG